MANMMIRAAVREDIPALAQLKYDYVRCLYRGFLPMEMLKKISAQAYAEQIEKWLEQELYRIDLCEEDGKIRAFVVFGENSREKGSGLIYEACCDHLFCMDDKRALVEQVLAQMREMGFQMVYQWILRDNFRVRFVFESLGFRPDGSRRTEIMEDQELILTRYSYPL